MDLTDARLAELFDSVEELRGDRVVTPLSGGLTNHNFKVDSAAGSFVVRISDPDTGLLAIDRDNEHVNSGRAKLFQDSFVQGLGVSLQSRTITDTEAGGQDPRQVI